MQFFTDTHVDFMGRRRIAFIISGVLILAGLVSLVVRGGPDFGVDFRGGVDIQALFSESMDTGAVRSALEAAGVAKPSVRRGNTKEEMLISAPEQSVIVSDAALAAKKDKVKGVLDDRWDVEFGTDVTSAYSIQVAFNEPVDTGDINSALQTAGLVQLSVDRDETDDMLTIISIPPKEGVGDAIKGVLIDEWGIDERGIKIDEVGAAVGRDLKVGAIKSAVLALILILIYIWFRFEMRFGIAAIITLIHDVVITLGIFSILREEINLPTIAGFLTIIGYSLNDTIVVFDRIRENSRINKGMEFDQIINNGINQTISRTIITSMTTLFAVVAIFALARVGTLHTLSLALLIGVIVGTYSSIFVASPILHGWHLRLQKEKS
ncbi:protein translocase subunit SecF [Candidatus Poribacteria bacterium]